MKKKIRLFSCLPALAFILTACQNPQEQTQLTYLETVTGNPVPPFQNSYYTLSERFPSLSEQLCMDIAIPETMLIYDSGSSDGAVRFAEESGKNLLTLETRFKDQSERCYQQYLHDVCSHLSEQSSFQAYPEPISINGYPAKRLDFKINTGTETRLVSDWFIDFEISPAQRGVCLISIESTTENIEAMLRILSTFHVKGDLS